MIDSKSETVYFEVLSWSVLFHIFDRVSSIAVVETIIGICTVSQEQRSHTLSFESSRGDLNMMSVNGAKQPNVSQLLQSPRQLTRAAEHSDGKKSLNRN